ncbi:hypothetical protein ACQ4M3_16000 [Leptolyngbya sp. AN03gr2]|uniref:hypothetical protein n=1 Tax=unclassified Leptolyngbya TaxID=2650499 RepID=UPI003D312000
MSALNYFPESWFGDRATAKYGADLQALGELPLLSIESAEVFRLLMCPALGSSPYSFLVKRTEKCWWLQHKWQQHSQWSEHDRTQTFFDPPRLHHSAYLLTGRKAHKLESLIQKLKSLFFSLPIQDDPLEGCFDGTAWLVEGKLDRQYHAICRRDPKLSALSELGAYLDKLTDFERYRV